MKKTAFVLMTALGGLSAFSGSASAADGAQLYASHCAVCHQSGAIGIPGQFPPLKGRVDKIIATPEGKTYVLHVVLNGMMGSLQAAGGTYTGFMPGLGSSLSDEDLAAVVTYVASLGGSASAPKITADDVKKARATPMQPNMVLQERGTLNAAHPLP
ncbi:cytochrome c [Acetobacter farinalis]|uniref:Cytochrome c n=1 Tax=Acetobacter farinalis TaxID=1260984 RepID=A0ABT3Q6R9_9PROT|nr:cytochrome c [Acetobacter farinalis]MCX2560954.1 cytochrome c [Acetobacter farinalis]NHO29603.1 c-type cytochrome [Acetobacter farinalis]